MSGKGLGDLERLALLAVLRLGDQAYAVSVRREIAEHTGRAASRGAVFVTLDRLERKGYLRSHMSEPTPERGGKAKRMFQVQASGIEALSTSLREIRELTRGLQVEGLPEWATS
ncbi:MAG: PadR family transcriptional regulator [Gemmatimonadetes bacterium]|nr:PadR family transcriptional regulator [Gemmatimonadota bacterium]